MQRWAERIVQVNVGAPDALVAAKLAVSAKLSSGSSLAQVSAQEDGNGRWKRRTEEDRGIFGNRKKRRGKEVGGEGSCLMSQAL